MTAATDRFFSQFDQLTSRVTGSRQQDFAGNLRRWLTCMDSAPAPIGVEFARLSAMQNWEGVQSDVMQPQLGLGPGQLNWPDDDDLRLAGQISLFRRLASGELDATNFAHDYFSSGGISIARTIQEMSDQLFRPLSEDLRLKFDELVEAAEAEGEGGVPAADRMVALDHNSRAYKDAVRQIEAVEEGLRTNNKIAPDDKARLQAEIESGKRLLAAPKTRVDAVRVVLLGALGWIAMTFASGALGELADSALHAVAALLGLPF